MHASKLILPALMVALLACGQESNGPSDGFDQLSGGGKADEVATTTDGDADLERLSSPAGLFLDCIGEEDDPVSVSLEIGEQVSDGEFEDDGGDFEVAVGLDPDAEEVAAVASVTHGVLDGFASLEYEVLVKDGENTVAIVLTEADNESGPDVTGTVNDAAVTCRRS